MTLWKCNEHIPHANVCIRIYFIKYEHLKLTQQFHGALGYIVCMWCNAIRSNNYILVCGYQLTSYMYVMCALQEFSMPEMWRWICRNCKIQLRVLLFFLSMWFFNENGRDAADKSDCRCNKNIGLWAWMCTCARSMNRHDLILKSVLNIKTIRNMK